MIEVINNFETFTNRQICNVDFKPCGKGRIFIMAFIDKD